MNLCRFLRSSLNIKTMMAVTLLISSNVTFAAFYTPQFLNKFYRIGQIMGCYTLDCAHWYVGGNIGVSHVYDERQPGLPTSMNLNGPGWNVNAGYQFNSILGLELGYTQYYNSRETIGNPIGPGSITVAETKHFSTYLAATGRYPLVYKYSALGKLGIAYSYANKVFNVLGLSASAGSVSLYWGLGVAYSVTPTVDFIAQWARARGNRFTGSNDLYSLGAEFSII